jgi:hypothetical protein
MPSNKYVFDTAEAESGAQQRETETTYEREQRAFREHRPETTGGDSMVWAECPKCGWRSSKYHSMLAGSQLRGEMYNHQRQQAAIVVSEARRQARTNG